MLAATQQVLGPIKRGICDLGLLDYKQLITGIYQGGVKKRGHIQKLCAMRTHEKITKPQDHVSILES